MTPPARPNLLEHLSVARKTLERRPSGLLTDVDGTLSPIAPTPEQAYVPEPIKRALARLASRLDLVAAVSGRPADEVRRLVGVDELSYVGNHGLELWEHGQVRLEPAAAPYLPLVERAARALAARLPSPEVRVEPKGITASIHYRQAADREAARAAILAALGEVPEVASLRVSEGRMVVNLVPPLDLHKGTAVLWLIRSRGLQGTLYLGDDVTDLDAFSGLRQAQAEGVATLAVAVASPESPPGLLELADYQVPGVEGTGRLLEALASS